MKLGNLIKKEMRELITMQTIFGMLFTLFIFIFMGQVIGGSIEDSMDTSQVNICNLDDSQFTQDMLASLKDYGSEPTMITLSDTENYYNDLMEQELDTVVIIPQGFGDSVVNGMEQVDVKCVTLINKGGLGSIMSSVSTDSLTGAISKYVSEYTNKEKIKLTEDQEKLIEKPVLTVEYTSANNKTVEIPAEELSAVMMGQSMIAPFAIFFLLLMASQMIMTAISTEKIDKTLETLLSAPVSRVAVLAAKMISSLVVALINAVVMIIGFAFYMGSIMGGALSDTSAATDAASAVTNTAGAGVDFAAVFDVTNALATFGFTLTPFQIAMFGIQLFLTIAIGLAISLILGAMATDVKSVQSLTLPMMIVVMIPFFVTMFSDVNSLSPVFKVLMYLIPFTHTYTAMSNMMFGNMAIFWIGLVYQAIFFVVCMYLAVRMFTTDRLFTMSFAIKSRAKKGSAGNENT